MYEVCFVYAVNYLLMLNS